MDLIERIKKSWAESEVAIASLYGQDVWDGYYKNNNTAKLLFIIPFVVGIIAADRAAYATLVLLWAAKKAKKFSELRSASDFDARLALLPALQGDLDNVALAFGWKLVRLRAGLDLLHDVKTGRYAKNPLLGELTEGDAEANLTDIRESLPDRKEYTTAFADAIAAIDGDLEAQSTFAPTADGTITAEAQSYW